MTELTSLQTKILEIIRKWWREETDCVAYIYQADFNSLAFAIANNLQTVILEEADKNKLQSIENSLKELSEKIEIDRITRKELAKKISFNELAIIKSENKLKKLEQDISKTKFEKALENFKHYILNAKNPKVKK